MGVCCCVDKVSVGPTPIIQKKGLKLMQELLQFFPFLPQFFRSLLILQLESLEMRVVGNIG